MSLIKSKQRVADHGEVFTPPWLVEKMLDLVKGESDRIDSRLPTGRFSAAITGKLSFESLAPSERRRPILAA